MQLQINATVYKKSIDQIRRMIESIPEDVDLRIDVDGGWDQLDLTELKSIHDFDLHIHEFNLGLAKLRNLQIEECTHEYIQFIDADDYLFKDNWILFREALLTKPWIISSQVNYVSDSKSVAREGRNLHVGNNQELTFFVIPSLIMKTDILQKNSDLRFDESGILFEDVFFSIVLTQLILGKINNVYRIDAPWYCYDITPSESLSRPVDNSKLIESTEYIIEELKTRDYHPGLSYTRMVEESLRLLQLNDSNLTKRVINDLKPYKFKKFYC